jgi:hypothetical protein
MPALIDISEILIWISITIFVFKMQSVKNKLVAESPQIYNKTEKNTNRIRNGIIIFLIIYMLGICTTDIVFVGSGNDDLRPTWDTLYTKIDAVIRIIKFALDVVLFSIFLQLYLFFFGLLKQKLDLSQRQLTRFNLLIFYWGLFLALL